MSPIRTEKNRKRPRRVPLMPPRVVLVGLLLLSVILSFASSSSLPSKLKRRNALFHRNEDFALPSPGGCDGKAVIPKHRKACGFYIWDFPSAILYKWCHRLLKDRIYEGKGGYIFVRYESNSILKLLYPCTRYSPNKCMICGGSYEDHLELWWSKHLYSPFDQYLDNTYNEALTVRDEDVRKSKKRTHRHQSNKQRNRTSQKQRNRRSASKSSSASPAQILTEPPYFGFHRRYVKDVTDLVRGVKDSKERKMLVRKKYPEKSNHIMIHGNDVMYIAPFIGGYGFDKKESYTKKDLAIDIFNLMLYSSIDATIGLQRWEFRRKKARNSSAGNRL